MAVDKKEFHESVKKMIQYLTETESDDFEECQECGDFPEGDPEMRHIYSHVVRAKKYFDFWGI